MIFFRKILFPFSLIYGLITFFRNYLFDIGVFKSYSFEIPIIAVGNLSVGGTGKTPQIEYLIRLLQPYYRVATLSRGYKRHSKGFVLASKDTNAKDLGDEPFQYFCKFPTIQVAVDADRKNGIEKLMTLPNPPQIILLDDAFQHRKVNAGFYILLTAYNELYCNDFVLPTGNLREFGKGAKRANLIIVTKCPENITEETQQKIKKEINLNVPIFFTAIEYDEHVFSKTKRLSIKHILQTPKVLLAGIAKPEPFFELLKTDNDVILKYKDHHDFSETDLISIKSQACDKIIITTEKDYARLADNIPSESLYYLPIKSKFVSNSNEFNSMIEGYIKKIFNCKK